MLHPLLSRLLIGSGATTLFPQLLRRLGAGDALGHWADRLLAAPLADLERLGPAALPVTPDVIDLAAGSAVVAAPAIRAEVRPEAWPDPAGLPDLRRAVSDHLNDTVGVMLDPADGVLVTAGTVGAVHTVFDAFVNAGDGVVLTDPCSPLFTLAARTRRASVRLVRTRNDGGRLRLRFDDLVRGLRGAKLLVLHSPHNPTGATISPEDIELVSWWANRSDVLVLSDESSADLSFDDPPRSIASFPAARPRTVVVGGVAKSHGLASLRVGWLAGDRHLVRACRLTAALRSPFVSAVAQTVALEALRHRGAMTASVRDLATRRHDATRVRLREMGISSSPASAGCHVWAEVPEAWPSGRAFAEVLLSSRKVRILPGHLFGPSGEKMFRLTTVGDAGRLEEGLSRIAGLVREDARPATRFARRAV